MKKIKKIALLPNVITAFGLSCGLFVIFRMNMIERGEVDLQALLQVTGILLLAAFSDLLDGAVARAIKAQSEFGGTFDTLADAISFGVAPSIIVLKSLAIVPGTSFSFLITAAAMVYSLSGVLRLVRFQVHSLVGKEDSEQAREQMKYFTGLPIPAAAAAIVSLNLFLFSNEYFLFSLAHSHQVLLLSFALVLIGYCMISQWKFPSVKTLEIQVASFQTLFLTVIAAALIFYGILHHFALIFLVLSWGYIFIAFIFSLLRFFSRQRGGRLEEVEVDLEEESSTSEE